MDTIDENKTQDVFIEDSDVKFNVISAVDRDDQAEDENEGSFWQNGFTIGLHISPLAMCLFTLLILMALLMRLALKIHKKRLEASSTHPTSSGQNKKKHSFDDVSLQTVSTN